MKKGCQMAHVTATLKAFGFKFQPQQVSIKWRQTDSKILDPTEIVSRSRAQDKVKVVHTLLRQGSKVELTVLPIIGMEGLGKTTFVQLVYNDSEIRKHFSLLLWVCVSDNFDVDLLAQSIIEAATKEKNVSSPLDTLQKELSGKRYLLVLDDVWNRDRSQWEKLKSNLQHGA
jgi:translation initiation factor RLI1